MTDSFSGADSILKIGYDPDTGASDAHFDYLCSDLLVHHQKNKLKRYFDERVILM